MKKEMRNRNNNLFEPKNLLIGFLLIIIFLLGFNYYSLFSQRNVNLENLKGELYSTPRTSTSGILHPSSLINLGDDSIVPPISNIFDESSNWCNWADINKDGKVDEADIELWREYEICDVLNSTNCIIADVNTDVVVDEEDYNIIVDNFGRTGCKGGVNICQDKCHPSCSVGCTSSNWCDGADINRDGIVDDKDVEIWIKYVNCDVSTNPECLIADINNDGVVGKEDYMILKFRYLRTGCTEDVQCIPNPELVGQKCSIDYLSVSGNSELNVSSCSPIRIDGICGGVTGESPGECVIPEITCDPKKDPSCKPLEPINWCDYITCPWPSRCVSFFDPGNPDLCAMNPLVNEPEPDPCQEECEKKGLVCFRPIQNMRIHWCVCKGCPVPLSPPQPYE